MQALACVAVLWAFVLVSLGWAQDTELFSCLPDTNVCSEAPAVLLEESCGEQFYFHRGRLSWPALRAVGPITIAVKVKHHGSTYLPLYVEIVSDVQSPECATGILQFPVLITEGAPDCGGTWYSVGPLDITRFTPLGTFYRVQVEFFDADPVGYVRSPGLACVRVTTPTEITPRTWSSTKKAYE